MKVIKRFIETRAKTLKSTDDESQIKKNYKLANFLIYNNAFVDNAYEYVDVLRDKNVINKL